MPNDIIYGMMILLFITVSKKSYGIVDKNILCRIKNIQSYKLVSCVQYFLIFTVSCSSCHSLKSVSRTLSCCIDNCLNKKNKTGEGARWSSGIDAAIGARGSRPVYYLTV